MESLFKDVRNIIGGLSESKKKSIETIDYLMKSKYTKTADLSGRVWPDVDINDPAYLNKREINRSKIVEGANHVKRLNNGYT